jgi:hypothetical protein
VKFVGRNIKIGSEEQNIKFNKMKNKTKQIKKPRFKFKWCIDFLLIGYIFQTLLLIIIVYSEDMSKMNWTMFIAIPYIFWGIELLRKNLV